MKITDFNISLLILMIMIFVSCNDKVEVQSKKVVDHKSLFLTLNPYDTNSEFYEKVKKLNKEHKLEKGKFILRLNNQNFPFDVIKNTNSISLSYSKEEEHLFSSLNYEISDTLNNKYKKILKTIKQIYDEKYVMNDKQIPADGLYYFENMKYTLYKDSDKYILFGYKLQDERIGNNKEREEEMKEFLKPFLGKNKSKNPISNVISSADAKNTFGVKIKIDYFEKKYIDSLLTKIDSDIKDSTSKKEKLKQQKDKENQKRKDNINNI